MSIFYESEYFKPIEQEIEEARQKKVFQINERKSRRGKKNEVFARYNNGNQRPTPSMVMTIPTWVVRAMGLKVGDKIVLDQQDPEDNPKGEIIFWFKKANESLSS